MGGGDDGAKNTQKDITQQQIGLSKDQQGKSNDIWSSLALPSLTRAKDWYTKLASGDSSAIATALGPVNQQIAQSAAATKSNIDTTMPRGGEKNLAKEMADVTAEGQTGRAATSAYTAAFPALASIGGNTAGISQNAINAAISALGGAGQTNANTMQADQASKSSTLGFIGSLAGAGAEMGAAFA